MQQKSKIIHITLASLLWVALQLPLLMGMVHFAEQHDHSGCSDHTSDIHLHEQKMDCDMFQLMLDSGVEFAFAKAEYLHLLPFAEKADIYTASLHNTFLFSGALRGPPAV